MKFNKLDFEVAFNLPPDKSILYLKSKGYKITKSWREMLDSAHTRAFTVAGVYRLEVLKTIQDSLADALGQGTTFQDWQKNLRSELDKTGLFYPDDSKKGEVQKEIDTPSRLDNIFRTNLQTALNAGRMERQLAVAKTRPYLRFYDVPDNRQSGVCSNIANKLRGMVIRTDHPLVNSIYPPNHFRCRSSMSSYSERERLRDGLQIYEGAAEGFDVGEGFNTNPLSEYKPDLSKYPESMADAYRKFLDKRIAEYKAGRENEN